MLDIVLLGLNHKTAPVELRECLAFSKEETDIALETLADHETIEEVLVLSTCNRVEVLLTTKNISRSVEAAKSFLSDFKKISPGDFEDSLYVYEGEEAVRHLFRVACSLDSMMVGEPQISGQIKEAYHTATSKKTSGVILNRLLHRAFFIAKRVRTETGVGDHAVSISYAAIELGRKIFGDLEGKAVLLIGAGEMAELAVEHLIRHRAGEIYVANRTFERGVILAKKFNGTAVRFEEIIDCLLKVDIIISSTGAPDFVIRRDHVKGLMRRRRNRPVFFIDIAVPRDIDPELNRLSNTYVYDIDDLKSVVDENVADRAKEAVRAERLVDEAVIRFRQWYESLSAVPTIVALRNKMETIIKKEMEKTFQSFNHISDEDRKAINKMTNALVNKILHDPTLFLKRNGFHGNKDIYLDATRKLFNLDE
jgi:glutamyl-tRNA reductase